MTEKVQWDLTDRVIWFVTLHTLSGRARDVYDVVKQKGYVMWAALTRTRPTDPYDVIAAVEADDDTQFAAFLADIGRTPGLNGPAEAKGLEGYGHRTFP